MKNRTIILLITLLTLATGAMAQRLEVRFNKEFSNDSLLNKTLGAGGSFIIDGWHPNLDVQINFDYAGHKGGTDIYGMAQKMTKLKAGVAALYSKPLGDRFFLRLGGELSYNNLHKTVTNYADTLALSHISTTSHYAHLLGIGAMAQIQAQLGNIFRLGIGVNPSYLIPLATKTSNPNVECDYKKGIFVLQLQIGLEIRLNNNNNQ